ncbi:hypothetical protein PFLA_b0301 [Pseudoalteromonas flavipulchra NCIMB 2033 = ATCC BAA-314]|nr:hypothetical protein [Pseudoalteromonas flavipulchra NCIMB 2033 = ATCC BAA-314]
MPLLIISTTAKDVNSLWRYNLNCALDNFMIDDMNLKLLL